jgi:hypothetical protein
MLAFKRTTIRFELEVKVQDVPRIEDLPAEEIQATWYTNEDFKRMRRRSSRRRLLKHSEGEKELLHRGKIDRQDSVLHKLILDSTLGDAEPRTPTLIPEGVKIIGKKRRIRFDMNIMTRNIEHIDDLSKEEILATWYSVKAFGRMRMREARLVRPVNKCGDVLEQSVFGGLGIETTEDQEQRQIRSRQAISCVISEQKQQKENGRHDPKLLARIYRMTAWEGCNAAHKRGWVHAELVRWEARVEEFMHLKSSSELNQNSVLSMPPPPYQTSPYQTLPSPIFSPHRATTRRWSNPLDTIILPPMR